MAPQSDSNNENNKKSLTGTFMRAALTGAKYTLKGVGIYLWPFAARWDRPFSRLGAKKKMVRGLKGSAAFAGVLILNQAFQTATGTLFPTGEEFMQAQGLNPALAQQLSDRPIRVRERDMWGTLHALNDIPTIFGVAGSAAMMAMPGQAYALPGENGAANMVLRYTPFAKYTHCAVMTQGDVSARETIAALGGFDPDYIEDTHITDRESQLAVDFHEFSHCGSDNSAHGMPEYDADIKGVLLLAKELDNPEIARAFMYARALGTIAHDHDTALFMDAALRGLALPRAQTTLNGATQDAFALARLYMRNEMKKETGVDYTIGNDPAATARALETVLKQYGKLLSPAGKRRAELYVEAVQYFMPQSYAAGHLPLPAPAAPAPQP